MGYFDKTLIAISRFQEKHVKCKSLSQRNKLDFHLLLLLKSISNHSKPQISVLLIPRSLCSYLFSAFLDTQESLAPAHVRCPQVRSQVGRQVGRLVTHFVTPSQSVHRYLSPLRYLIRVMRQNEPGMYGDLNASQKCV